MGELIADAKDETAKVPTDMSIQLDVWAGFDKFIHDERAELVACIQSLRTDSARLLRENASLMRAKESGTLSDELAKSIELRQDLAAGQEALSSREAGFTSRLKGIRAAVTGNGETEPAPSLELYRTLRDEIQQRADEMKRVREFAESRAAITSEYIRDLQREIMVLRSSSPETSTHDPTTEEMKALKTKVKKLEVLALEYVPLAAQELVDESNLCKEEIMAIQKRQKQRRKKELLRQAQDL